jgi:hypothetical protein
MVMGTIVVSLENLPPGETYEDRYGAWLEIFHQIAVLPKEQAVEVVAPPWSWVPLLCYLGCTINPRVVKKYLFEHDPLVENLVLQVGFNRFRDDRTLVETLCTLRPECIDALWKIDAEWRSVRPKPIQKKEFIVTTTAAFYRPEVLEFIDRLHTYTPTKRKVIMVPCAADKPYPAPIHRAVKERMPDDWYLLIATGTLGVVPEDLWSEMPHYDAGIPNFWRVMQQTATYFGKHPHLAVLVYSDFLSMAIEMGFREVASIHYPKQIYFLFSTTTISDVPGYENLLDEKHLNRLEEHIRMANKGLSMQKKGGSRVK